MALCVPWDSMIIEQESMMELQQLNLSLNEDASGQRMNNKIRGLLIAQDTMDNLAKIDLNKGEFKNLNDKSITEWVEYLDIEGVTVGTTAHFELIWQWCMIKNMIERYQKFEGKATLEVPLYIAEVPMLIE